jgi:putative endopeptidase
MFKQSRFLSHSVSISFALVLASCSSDEPADTTAGTAATEPATQAEISSNAASPEFGSFGVDLENRDTSIRPGDDFFMYANGNWVDSYDIPDDRARFSTPIVLRDTSNERVQTIVDDLISMEPATGSLERKVSDYYNSYMDVDTLNALGISPLNPYLAALDEISSKDELIAAFGRARIDNTSSPINFSISTDRADPNSHQLSLRVGGFSLPDRDYYLVDSERNLEVRQEFIDHVARILNLAGIENSEDKAQSIFDIETRIAEFTWPRDQRRNRDLTYNPMSYDDFLAEYSGFDWQGYFSAAGVGSFEDLNVVYPSAMSPTIELVDSVSIEDWKSLMTYRLINDSASFLSEEFADESFHFYSTVLRGIPSQRERWERGVARVGSINSLGEVIGQVYVAKHFPPEAKAQMSDLVENLRQALGLGIDELDWMSDATKAEAHMKLNSFRSKIAYPDEWTDLSGIEVVEGDLFATVINIREFNYQDSLSRLGQPTRREEWAMTPQTVNAYYSPSFNEIVFPAAILQAPFFDPAADPAVNYGGIGSVIGHELGHGFDDQGSKFDFNGIQRNWWTDDDRAKFDEITSILAAQYDEFEPVEGYFVDGNFTLGENIGDLGGLYMAYRAYKLSLDGEEAPIIDGFTGDQRFFLAYAQLWKGKIRDDALIQQLSSDPHSPAVYRSNGVVRNMDEWYEAFDVQPGDALYLPPEERIRIW